MGLWKLTFPSYGALKGGHTFLFSTEQIFCRISMKKLSDFLSKIHGFIPNFNKIE